MKVAFVFGGSGYIAHFLICRFIENQQFDKIVIYDIQQPKYFKTLPTKIQFELWDVRKPIPTFTKAFNVGESWIFNLAAVHREPGHEMQEYFDTNINGANNINAFAETHSIKNIFFTSSIAPYGKSLNKRTEQSALYPETPYGISKGMAELIHQKWLGNDASKRLIIVRPSVIYGPHDPGNIYRTIKALKKGTFIIPNHGNIIKAYGYVYGLIDSVEFTMKKNDRLIIYNYAENPVLDLNGIVAEVKNTFGYKKPTPHVPVFVLGIAAFFIQIICKLTGKKSDIHPVRVRKAAFPTNIEARYLIENGFQFNYGFEKSLKHWQSIAPEDFE